LAHLAPSAFQSTSLFLGKYLAETLRNEELTYPVSPEWRRWFSKRRPVDASFAARFKGKPWQDISDVSYKHLFRHAGNRNG
jgi:hypothetical protein